MIILNKKLTTTPNIIKIFIIFLTIYYISFNNIILFLFIFIFFITFIFLFYFSPIIYVDTVEVWFSTGDLEVSVYDEFIDNCFKNEGARLTFLKSAAVAGSIIYKIKDKEDTLSDSNDFLTRKK
jgi:hypothetical protein